MVARRLVTDGARALRRWIDKRYRERGGVPKFCEEMNLSRVMVQRALNGSTARISVDFAKQITLATKGAVKWDQWASDTAATNDVAA